MCKLKPCPFCGCEEAGTQWHHGYWSVTCGYNHDCTPSNHCFQDWGEFETEEEAINTWNIRAKDTSMQKEKSMSIELPCEEGDSIWRIVQCSNNLYINSTNAVAFSQKYIVDDCGEFLKRSEIDKTIFFDVNEAELKLEEIKNNG